jgi:pilus assembly protein CpaF
MTDPALVARVRAEVAAGVDPAGLLAAYAQPARRVLLRERVRVAARVALADSELDAMCAELFGFGPLQPLLDDPDVTDVLVNGPSDVFCERSGRLERVDVAFRSADDVAELAHRIAGSVARELTLERPFVDARMRDGSRANAVIAPIGGPSLSIRKFNRLSIPLRGPAPSWVASGLHDDAAALLEACVRERTSILVSGATGSGKSTLLRSLAGAIPEDERLIVIEDTNELVLPHPHVVHLECVPARDGSGIGIADLVANALRMRPDRILVGEVRTPREASALLEALSTGHEGSLTTIHAGSAVGAIDRLALLLARAGELGTTAIARHVAQGIDVLVHVARDRAGTRSVREIAAIEESGLVCLWRAGDDTVRLPARLRHEERLA